ncbi:expressed unknown protein [Seminavis robusta]|uniref:L domain-like protein n=1 Tax=Seminavis robusta TaxID=568900 RepID=A0A9N8I097_9STRA|nr:expressed unknown protein [Seminavis robusta]|eukprot:Sro2583_g331881.1  (813) ;mRNA; f:4607-7045
MNEVEDGQQDDTVDVVRDVLLKRAEAEAAQIEAEECCKEDLETDTVVLDILTERPALEAAQFEKDEETATSRDLKLKSLNLSQSKKPEKEKFLNMSAGLAVAKKDLHQDTSETREEEIMEIVAGQVSLAVAQRLSNAKQDLHNKEKPSTYTDENNLMEIAAEINEASKLGKFANAANNPSNKQETALGREQLNSVPATEAVPQPALRPSTQMRPQSQPGAFPNAPGGQMQRNPNLNYGLVGANSGTASDPEDASVGMAGQISTNEGLVQANAVEDDTAELMHANPVDLEATQHRALQKKQQQKTFFAAALWLLLVVAIIVGFVVGTQKNKEPKVVVLESTEAPTVYGSMQPSEVPSMAPTGSLNVLLDSLPEYTLASINNGSETPQWKAWWWLANHQNITFLPEWRKTQLFALATFFFSFEGESWNHLIKDRWMDDTVEECDWFSSGFGLFIDETYVEFQNLFVFVSFPVTPPCDSQGQFTSLDLQDLQLSGFHPSVPPEIALLTSLSHLALQSNGIAVPFPSLLPAEFYSCTSLTSVELAANLLSGQMPTEFGLMTLLEMLKLNDNQLTGEIASELGFMISLDSLELHHNDLTSALPSEVGKLTALEWLNLGYNELAGQLPSELGLLTLLIQLKLHDNQLTGSLHSEFGILTSLKYIDLFRNQFTGALPSELSLVTSLEELRLYDNQFTSTIPMEVAMMTSLTSLGLHNNDLTGTLPSQLNASMGLRLYGNQFLGSVPSHLCSFLFCDCSLNETPPVSTCADLKEAPPDWPGRFPTTGSDVMLNIYTDYFPEETSWVWQKETNVTGTWDTL